MEICQQKNYSVFFSQNFKDYIAWLHDDSHESLKFDFIRKQWKNDIVKMCYGNAISIGTSDVSMQLIFVVCIRGN